VQIRASDFLGRFKKPARAGGRRGILPKRQVGEGGLISILKERNECLKTLAFLVLWIVIVILTVILIEFL
jgi:hypothetical protein